MDLQVRILFKISKVAARLAVHQELAVVPLHLLIPWTKVPALNNRSFNHHIAGKILYLTRTKREKLCCFILHND